MTIKELKEKLAEYPDNMEVAIDDEDIWYVIDFVETNYDDNMLLIGNTDGFIYQH